jgi:hypothetical protein
MDALNGGVSGLERGRSEASSMVSEVPDYLFGLDNNSEETQQQNRELLRPKERSVLQQLDNVSNSDPGSPAPVVSSPFCSTSSASIPNLPPVKTKPENPVYEPDFKTSQIETETVLQPQLKLGNYQINPGVHYPPQVQPQQHEAIYSGHHGQPVPVYYIQGSVQPGNVPVQQVHMQGHYPPYVQQPYHTVMQHQVPIGYHQLVPGSGQVYGAGMRHMAPVQPYSPTAVVHDGLKQQVYQGVQNPGPVPVYQGMPPVTGGDEQQRGGTGRGTNSPHN